EYAWYRKVKFIDDVKLDDTTMILNQIYLDPAVQRHGLGTYVLAQTLPKMKEKGVKNLILEYNADNKNAEKFYHYFGFRALAETQDLDHIIKDEHGHTKFCISDVKMVHVPIDIALEKANSKIKQKQQETAHGISNVLVGRVKYVHKIRS
ncbi:MAG: GNAT family N-acetyltransferase, partial [Alphaproteobacteria bacterium]|nr:GNAT family N-acetyltransferase [Alphaproteobacteria bacterium]